MVKNSSKLSNVPKVHIADKQNDLVIDHLNIETLVHLVLQTKKVQCDEVSLYFVDSQTIASLHETYFNDPSVTDCITFPLDDDDEPSGYRILGEIFVCPKVALDYATEHHIDPAKELSLYIIHGILHLLGFDDIDPKDRLKMKRQERSLMKLLEEKNKFPQVSLSA